MSVEPTPVELSVIVPCFNEEDNLAELVARTLRVFARRQIAGELVLVNDGSRDRTAAVLDDLARTHPAVVPVHHPVNRGIAAGWASGLAAARGRYVCIMDADLQYQPEAIAQLHREMQFSHADLVQGYRSMHERHRYDHRYYMSRGLDYLLKLAFGMPEHDVKSGFLLCKREVFEDILRDVGDYYYFQHMITVVAKSRGYSIRQVETLFEERRAGQSFITGLPFTMIARTFADIARGFLRLRLRDPRDSSLAAALGARELASAPRESAWRRRALRALGPGLPADVASVSTNGPGYLAELRQTQWLPAAELERLQLRRFRRLLSHAQDHVGYFREVLRSTGLRADEVRGPADLARIPLLTRELIRDNVYFDLLADNHVARRLYKLVSCGADGDPLGLFVDQGQLDMRWAMAVRGLEWTGWRRGDLHVRIVRPAPEGRLARLRLAIDGRRAGQVILAGDAVTHADVDRLIALMRTRRPVLLEADSEILLLIAALLAERRVEPLPAGAIVTHGQTLGRAARALLERQFAGRVFDVYGLREFGAVATECPSHAGYHVHAEGFIVEVLCGGRPAVPGESGDLVITDLTNRAVPLVRRQVGDRAVLGEPGCSCGRGLPLLTRIVGRAPAAVEGTEGRFLPAGFFDALFVDYEYAVGRYQVRQSRAGRIELHLVRKNRFTADTADGIRAAVVRAAGAGAEVVLEFHERLPPGPTCESPVVAGRFPTDDDGDRREVAS